MTTETTVNRIGDVDILKVSADILPTPDMWRFDCLACGVGSSASEHREIIEGLAEEHTRQDHGSLHNYAHPLAGKTVQLGDVGFAQLNNQSFTVEDWWDRITGNKSWRLADGNPAAMTYGYRIGLKQLPNDDEVVYGKVGGLGYLVHITELQWP